MTKVPVPKLWVGAEYSFVCFAATNTSSCVTQLHPPPPPPPTRLFFSIKWCMALTVNQTSACSFWFVFHQNIMFVIDFTLNNMCYAMSLSCSIWLYLKLDLSFWGVWFQWSTELSKIFSLKPGYGQNIALHALPTANYSYYIYILVLPSGFGQLHSFNKFCISLPI